MSSIASPASALCLYEPGQTQIEQTSRSSPPITVHERRKRGGTPSHRMPRGTRDFSTTPGLYEDGLLLAEAYKYSIMKNRVDQSRTRMPIGNVKTTIDGHVSGGMAEAVLPDQYFPARLPPYPSMHLAPSASAYQVDCGPSWIRKAAFINILTE
jgi:hypothetical protein